MPESTQHKLDRIRPPRVQITYDVEIGDAIVKKELPFVVGIMADLSGTKPDGKPVRELEPLRKRKYIEIDRDNFNDVLASAAPQLTGVKPDLKISKDNVRFVLNKDLIKTLKETHKISDEALERLKSKDDRREERFVVGEARLRNKIRKALGDKELRKINEDVPKAITTVVGLVKKDAGWIEPQIQKLNDLTVNLKFGHLDDFTPVKVLRQVPELNDLFEARRRLNDLLAKLDGNEPLDEFFQQNVGKTDAQIPLLAAATVPAPTNGQQPNPTPPTPPTPVTPPTPPTPSPDNPTPPSTPPAPAG